MDIVEQLQGAHWTDASERLRLIPIAIDEIKRLRRDVEEANARAYVMAQEVTLWQDRALAKTTGGE